MPQQVKRPQAAQTQSALVKEQLGSRADQRLTPITERIDIPGIESLHLKSTKEVAEMLANILKSRNKISILTYHVGKYVEITSESDLALGLPE